MARLSAAILVIAGIVLQTATALAGGYGTPTAGQSPHGDYADTTSKCKICHAAHNANASIETSFSPPQALLRTTRGVPSGAVYSTKNGMACAYCHIVGSWSIKKVYGGLLSNYQGDSRHNHDDNHRRMVQVWGGVSVNYVGCMSCHSVHGANLLAGYEADIVSNNPNPNWSGAMVDNLTNFCRDCHDDTSFLSGRWGTRCGLCHVGGGVRGGEDTGAGWPPVDNYPPFYTQDRDGVTHIMTTTLTGPSGMQVAWTESDQCTSCHGGGNHTENNSFPHYTSGAQFLDDAYTPADTGMDRVCLNCHVQGGDGGAYTTGVGRTF